MNWSSISNAVGKVAPFVGTALGGPAGGAVGKLLAGVLGVEPTPDAISDALRNDPQALVKLKQFELENEQQIRDMAFKTLDVELKDKQSARLAHKESAMPAIICVALTLMVFLGGYAIFMTAIPDKNETLANLVFGALLAKWGDSIAYWVGTTRSSSDKNKLLNQK
jgi:hypothetical protein